MGDFTQGTGRKGIFCVIVPQDPRKSTLYFTAPTNQRTGGKRRRRVTASLPSPRLYVAIEFRKSVLKGDPSGSYDK
jgi:hypothetical protein